MPSATLLPRAFFALCTLLAAAACRSNAPDPAPHAYGDVRQEGPALLRDGTRPAPALAQQEPADPQPVAAPRGEPAPTPGAAATQEPARPANRDPKGQRDVEAYIAHLERPERVQELKIEVVLDKLDLPRDAVIGDLGCGPGLFALPFARVCSEGLVYASDVEPVQVDRVRERAEAAGLRNVIPVIAGLHDPHFPLRSLDYVFIADTYHHLEDRVAYMRRLKDVLRPGGRVVLFDYKPGPLPVGPPAEHKLAPGVMGREMQAAGFVLIDRFNTHAYHDFEVWRVKQTWEPQDS